ncbi:hypothetical protein AYO44_03555 [Planctomycetaceae bacterium SCGC AG-212-F19]|nr:hypothetical protein AYO44_03555 [Planctomycetaceae bacterium SCGC AG-212-F19]
MSQRFAGKFAAGLALAALLVSGPAGLHGEDPKTPPNKDGGKQPNSLQALQDAFSKGVSLKTVEPKDLPKEITEAATKKVPGASIKKAQKQEIRHTMQYVAFDKPKVQSYQATIVKDDKRSRVQLAPDGKVLSTRPVAAKDGAQDKIAPADDKKEIDIPPKASKSVKAIKEFYPDAVVKEITTEVYQDPSGTVDVLTYEIEFISKGTKREMVASPEGVIPHLWKPIAEQDLPKAVADALAKEVPGGKVESAAQYEIRAGLQFVPLAEPRVVYQLELDKDGQPSKLNLRADGTLVPAPVRPGPPRAFLGLAFEKNTTTVSQVTKDGPAEQAGIKPGDKVLALGDAKIASVPDLLKALQSMKPGTEVKLQYERGDKTLTAPVKLGAPPGQ